MIIRKGDKRTTQIVATILSGVVALSMILSLIGPLLLRDSREQATATPTWPPTWTPTIAPTATLTATETPTVAPVQPPSPTSLGGAPDVVTWAASGSGSEPDGRLRIVRAAVR